MWKEPDGKSWFPKDNSNCKNCPFLNRTGECYIIAYKIGNLGVIWGDLKIKGTANCDKEIVYK